MIKLLLERAIQQKNQFMNDDMIKLQIEFFTTAGRITENDRLELLEMVEPPIEEPGEE